MPHRHPSSDDTHAMVARIAPAIIKLLSDGLPRTVCTLGLPFLRPHMEMALCQVEHVPAQAGEPETRRPLAIGEQDRGGVAMAVSALGC